ncbi:putative mitochondrial acyl-CoA oxidase [Leptomonas pyrrhocoris]|uniref:Putative mitochondrial acyl-CoA oxidase n=1 Tax=Leptomonas pyrrhocoris TaxID=157538 RepID=A0A0N0DYK1_LEPPY|nr:putative mitochondrial acyl-CoA oxidase [Leptomonas pyrrhocoris]KPA84215.1 putative mitochondrial acyl-CoA oxidase [Leptomonas pyrrhocoris]|eukprot:XP_015662654.1 putative mitochondrial acyl-CoA oxidase [Leptomonas pyrrhocoris]
MLHCSRRVALGEVTAVAAVAPSRLASSRWVSYGVAAGAFVQLSTCVTTTSFSLSPLLTSRRGYVRRTCPRFFEIDPSRQRYVIESAFEEPTFRYICEGADIDFKEEVREALKKSLPQPPSNFTQRDPENNWKLPQMMQVFQRLCRQQLVSYAQVRSTPRRLASFYETLATAHPALALLAAEHFTFAGLVATHAKKKVRDAVLANVDSGVSIGCIAEQELIAEGPPFNTEARYDAHEHCFVLRGTGKFGVVAAACAEWAVVTATLTLKAKEDNGTHLFLVPLRGSNRGLQGTPQDSSFAAGEGELRRGISIRAITGESDVMSGCGVAVLHFDDVRIPVDNILNPFCITPEMKVGYVEGRDGDEPATEVLRTRRRIATGAVYVGATKKLLTDVVTYTANKCVVGPDYRRNYPFLGLQHIQTPLVSMVAKTYVYLLAWQRLLTVFTDAAGKGPCYEDHMRLAGTIHFLQENLLELHNFVDRAMGLHGSLASSGSNAAATLVHLRQEGLDTSSLIREVAFKSITKNIGTTHWGWWLTSLLQSVSPALDRFVKNPLYSPRIADLGRHLLFFSHKHYSLKKRLRRSRELERRKGGSEHQWYDWVMFRHRTVVHCGEAFMEMYYMDVMMQETEKCGDLRGRKILRDIGWIYALSRQMDRLDFILSAKMMSSGKAEILAGHFDNLVTVLAPQCVHLVEAMQVPQQFLAPCAAGDHMEAYWTIPGTNTHIERGSRLTLHEAATSSSSKGRAEPGREKAEQEAMRESSEDFDLFHGLADEPSYARRKL